MNPFVIKYGLLISAILASTIVVAGPFNPQDLFTGQPYQDMNSSAELSADSIYQFGSSIFYKEINKPGNEYLKQSVEGYSPELVTSDKAQQQFQYQWNAGISAFELGNQEFTDAFFQLVSVPDMSTTKEKNEACDKFRNATEDLRRSESFFTAAKASSSPGSASGFTIGLVLPKVNQVTLRTEDAGISCMKAVLADRDADKSVFQKNLQDVQGDFKEIQGVIAELKVLSNDF